MDLRLPEPDASGIADVAGVQIAWASFGHGESAVLVIPTWNFVDSRVSGRLVPDLSRSFRVVTFDPRGAGRSDRPPTGYRVYDHLADAIGVMQAAGLRRASVVAASSGANSGALLAARRPDMVERLVLIAPAMAVAPDGSVDDDSEDESDEDFWVERTSYEGWERWSAPYWRKDWATFARWFLELVFNEPGSEAVTEAVLAIALDADPEVLIQQHLEQHRAHDSLAAPAILDTISAPTLVLHGEFDESVPLGVASGIAAAIPGAVLAVVVDGGHRPDIRTPELTNPLLVDFLHGQRLAARPGIDIRLPAG